MVGNKIVVKLKTRRAHRAPMEKQEYIKMAEQESTYWWYVGRIHIVKAQLKKVQQELGSDKKLRILNVGSGTGGTIPMLQEFGEVFNVDVSDQALGMLKEQGIKNLHKITDSKLPFKDSYFDIAIAMDVLEHIKDDSEALNEWSRVIKQSGRLVLTVPAYQWLWSEHDESLHHFRRYTASNLHRLFNQANFRVRKRSYMIMFSFPLVVGYRFLASIFKKSKNDDKSTSHVKVPKIVNQLFIELLKIESFMLKYLSLPFGTSILMIGRNHKE